MSTVTPIRTGTIASGSADGGKCNFDVDVIDEHLRQAYSTLDLIYSAAVGQERAYLERLSEGTLVNAVDGCMRHLERAMEAVEQEART